MHRTQVYLINDSSANTLKCSQKTHFHYRTSYLYLICCLIVSLAPSLSETLTNNHRWSGAKIIQLRKQKGFFLIILFSASCHIVTDSHLNVFFFKF